MNENVCPRMNGAKCAGDWCDLWDHENQKCLKAIEVELRVEILRRTVEITELQREEVETKQKVEKFKREKNVVDGSNMVN